jgi:tetratricopeptide (TPR) repeat protein
MISKIADYRLPMRSLRRSIVFTLFLALLACVAAATSRAANAEVPPEVPAILDKIYAFDLGGAEKDARHFQSEYPGDPVGFLLEGEALWWRIWCTSAEYKWGMSDTSHRGKVDADQHYLDISAKAYALAVATNRRQESARMHFYAGMADALTARLYALRGENRATARVGVRARQSFLHALEIDPQLADADFGLGLYNYYVDTLSSFTKMLRFFMGIPGGSKQEGLRQLERAMSSGELTASIARIYLALNLHRYDQQYARALETLNPIAEKYPSNPLFQLMVGDLHAKLGHREQALAHYRAAAPLAVADAECHARVQALAAAASAAVARPDSSRKP